MCPARLRALPLLFDPSPIHPVERLSRHPARNPRPFLYAEIATHTVLVATGHARA